MDIAMKVWAALLGLVALMAAGCFLSALWSAGTWLQAGELPLYDLGVAAKAYVAMKLCLILLEASKAFFGLEHSNAWWRP